MRSPTGHANPQGAQPANPGAYLNRFGRPREVTKSPRSRLWLLLALAVGLATAGCTTGPPPPVSSQELAGGELFPFFKVYWVGRYFSDQPLTAVDNRENYIPSIGESADYGTCAPEGGLLGGGPCQLPLQVTTVVYVPHENRSLGTQQNTVIRGVPAVIYDQGRQIVVYSGHLQIDVAADTGADALRAANLLRPLNAPGSAAEPLPPPTYCPGLWGPLPGRVGATMARLRAHLPKLACPPLARSPTSPVLPKRAGRPAGRAAPHATTRH